MESVRSLDWLRVLRWSCLYVFVTGLLPVLAVFETTQEPWRLFFDLINWPLDGEPAQFTNSDRQLSAILGGVLCGWSWLLYKLSWPEVFNARIRKAMMQSVWFWFVLDSGGSIVAGLPLNVLSNATFLLLLLVPLHALKR